VIQLELLDDVQLQPEPAVTVTVPVSAPEPCDRLVGEIAYVEAHSGGCVTVNVFPAIVIVPVRVLPVEFAVTEYPAVPFPLALAPEVTVIQLALLVAVQLQALPAVTDTVPVSAPEPCVRLVGEIAYVEAQSGGCVTVNVFPAIVIVPVRVLPVEFAVTEYPTAPFPPPLAPEVTVIQPSLLAAVQLQPEPAVTVTVPVSAPEPCDRLVGEIAYVEAQSGGCVTVNVLPAIVIVPVRVLPVEFAVTE
jgi:hypothetical protein